ncbi:MAG: ABC transporter ATP-binding protein [Flavobacteriales bacterium]|jgi:lipoprotein-releasing system ATP-binding protein|nr:MAG: ABC transporter ATP-binding protein [Flavobacteriales bacterium]
MSNGDPVIEARGIIKWFRDPVDTQVLKGVDLKVMRGEYASVMGKSGCGKSTLLYILSTMDTDYTGDLFLDGERITGSPHEHLSRLRNEKIGFVFQFHYLIPEFTVLRNVMLPGLKRGLLTEHEVEERAMDHLRTMGVDHQARKRANQISGGEKQRVAIARALINEPLILMCDEPTGNLDSRNSAIVEDLFRRIADEQRRSLLVVTHDDELAARTDRIITMDDGRVVP